MKSKISAVVVLYHPDDSIFKNISSYIDDVSQLYVVDNSESKNHEILNRLQKYPKITYIDNKGNQGIAQALNTGAARAIEDGYEWLLTMDQDSRFDKKSLDIMITWSIENKTKTVGIISPMHSLGAKIHQDLGTMTPGNKTHQNLVTMTSGNLLNLKIFQKIGGFDEKLFIDSVDIEYCLRLNLNGYHIQRCKDIILKHNLGDRERKKFLFFSFYVTNHNATRRYYITRNRLYIWAKYEDSFPQYLKYEKKTTLKEIVKILLAEDDKILKFKMIFQGYMDYKKGKFGKFNASK